MWSGKQIFSAILRPNKKSQIKVNMCISTREDEDLVFRNSEFLSGTLNKSVIGCGMNGNIVQVLLRDYGQDEAIKFMSRLCRLAPDYLTNRGFSLGISDVTPSHRVLCMKEELLDKGYAKCKNYIRQHKEGRLPVQTGTSAEDILEYLIRKGTDYPFIQFFMISSAVYFQS